MPQGKDIYVTVGMPARVHEWVAKQAREADVTIPAWIRERMIADAPLEVRQKAKLRQWKKQHTHVATTPEPVAEALAETSQPLQDKPKPRRRAYVMRKGPKPDPKPVPPTEAELIERHRDRVLELEARGYLPNQIAATTRLPYAVVHSILTTKAAPKRKPR